MPWTAVVVGRMQVLWLSARHVRWWMTAKQKVHCHSPSLYSHVRMNRVSGAPVKCHLHTPLRWQLFMFCLFTITSSIAARPFCSNRTHRCGSSMNHREYSTQNPCQSKSKITESSFKERKSGTYHTNHNVMWCDKKLKTWQTLKHVRKSDLWFTFSFEKEVC